MKRSWLGLVALVALAVLDCRPGVAPDHAAPAPEETWSVTAWGKSYEVFAETDALVVGQAATCNAHVTVLEGFTPLKSGKVVVFLRGTGADRAFQQDTPVREGIYPVEISPGAEGTFEMVFRIEGPAGSEDIIAGSVRVGTAESPGGPAAGEDAAESEAVSFLKEQQWRTGFATTRVTEGALRESITGPGRVTAAAGGEAILTAAVDATVASDPWPFPGLDAPRGKAVLRLLPRVGGRSLPDLQAEEASLGAEVEAARRRLDRLTELLRVEATSTAEVERARATLTGFEARLRAARLGVSAATAPAGSSSEAAMALVAPWSGRIAEVLVSPGQTVPAGEPLVRLVKVRPLWIVMAVRPEDAPRIGSRPSGLLLRRPGSEEILELIAREIRIVSRSPEVDPRTASISLIVEVDRSASELPIGSAVEADLLLSRETRGIVVPAPALVDDGGVLVVYIQISGESFARRAVRVVARQGRQVLVEGLEPGVRLVTLGGGAIRRNALLSSGAPEAHVH